MIDFGLDFQLPICVMRYFPVRWVVCLAACKKCRERWKVNDLISHNARERLCQFSNASAAAAAGTATTKKTYTPLAFIGILFSFCSFVGQNVACNNERMCSKTTKYIYQYVICAGLRIFMPEFKRDTQSAAAHTTKIITNAYICMDYFFTPCASGFCSVRTIIAYQRLVISGSSHSSGHAMLITFIWWWYTNCNLDLIHRHHYYVCIIVIIINIQHSTTATTEQYLIGSCLHLTSLQAQVISN